MITIPNINSIQVSKLISELKIENEPFYIEVIPEPYSEINNCFFNVRKKIERAAGEIIYGWQIWEYPFMIEAEFHAVWKSSNNDFIDITPKAYPNINRILFLPDLNKVFDGQQSDNIRLNTTTNKLIDDFIELGKIKFKFLNKGERKNIIGEIILKGKDFDLWEGINKLESLITIMYFQNKNENSYCLCNSNVQYKNCHRQYLQALAQGCL